MTKPVQDTLQLESDNMRGKEEVLEERTVSKLAAELRPMLEEMEIYDVRVAPRLARFLRKTYCIMPAGVSTNAEN